MAQPEAKSCKPSRNLKPSNSKILALAIPR
jgi:hypothetical protein